MELSYSNRGLIKKILESDPRVTISIVSCTKEKIWDIQIDTPTYISAEKAYIGEEFKKFPYI
ncbi:hypothetical protein LCGC14_1261700 [marine sediment metagenome]|uniref:Uncharacterized protein n=1 Tax=marine sediment metagenome TaxID=412755 RepID=A0A0F9LLQ2_9ZZZZ|nr:hypothetical protein [bacterium]